MRNTRGKTTSGRGASTGATIASTDAVTAQAARAREAGHDAAAAPLKSRGYGRWVWRAGGRTATTRLTTVYAVAPATALPSAISDCWEPRAPIIEASAAASSTLPALKAASHHERPISRLPASAP